MALLRPLLDVQHIDTALLQLRHRVATLPELATLATATSVRDGLNKEITAVTTQCKSSQSEIDLLETANARLDAAVDRFAKQLKTVIAPREAEALQHEIAMATIERSANDDRELELLEQTEQYERKLTELATRLAHQEEIVAQTNQQLARMLSECSVLQSELEAKRTVAVAAVEPRLVVLYETKRSQRNTPAVADLHGATCQACHLDLSTVELAALKKLAIDELPGCSNCGCLLVF